MPNKLELQNLKKRKEQLEKAVEFTKQKKEQIVLVVQNLVKELNSGKITRNEYEEKLSQALKNRTAEQWLKYYDDYIKYYNYQIESCNKLIKQETKKIKTIPVLKLLILIISISLIISLIFILKPVFIEKTKVSLKPELPVKPKIILEQAKILEETFAQLSAIAGKPVKWQLEFNLDTPSSFNTKLPPESKLISVKNEQGEEVEAEVNKENVKVIEKSKKFQIIYETPAPEIKEEVIGENKKLTITAPIAYSNIFSHTELPNELSKEELAKLKLYYLKDNQRQKIEFTAYDTNENNLFDYIEFIAPNTGEYELVIEISRAEHLDTNRENGKDIYETVKALDNNWSEAINENEYVRVTFQQKLDNSRDITIYPRIVSGNPRIEVYEINGTEKITEFSSLISNQYNKVYLTNLPENYYQDVFDLRVINGNIEIEHIVDPVYTSNLWVDLFNPVSRQWTEVGTSPWLNTQNYPSNYIYTNKQNNLHGDFNFQDLPTGTTSINSATLYIYLNPGTESIQAEVWDGATWNVFILSTSGWSWRSVAVNFLNTPAKVNNAKLRLRSKGIGGWSGQAMVDAAYLSVSYNAPNQPPQITYIEPILDQTPIENSVKTITFNVRVSDPDGVIDIDDSSVIAEFSKIGETKRTGICPWQNDIDSNTANYSCSVGMQYYDGAGTWNIKINATDFANNLIENTSRNFVYQELKAIIISPLSLTWPQITPGAINQLPGTSTIITNTGNHEGGIIIQAKNLYGGTRTTEYIPANAFTSGAISGADEECNAPATATQLEDSNPVPIINSMLNKGPAAQEEIFYCIPQVPQVSSQTYSTQTGSWTITVFVLAIIIKKKEKLKKRQKSNKTEIAKDNLIISLNLLSKEIKQEYSKEKQEIILLLTKEIKKKYELNNKELIQLTETEEEAIPLSIFKYKSGALESICRYMKENLNMKYRKIAGLLQRNERTIWTAYNKAKQKQPETIKIKQEKILLPISIFNKKLTILESIIIYLKKQNLRYVEIAELLNRDQRNIWTIYSRAIKK
jgi:hypothetical protein